MIQELRKQIENLIKKLDEKDKNVQAGVDGITELTTKFFALNQEYQLLLAKQEK